MSSLLLKFRGPLQSWGSESRFRARYAGSEPSKSAVIGLLAAAEGRRRSDSVEDLVELEFGVRTDQVGKLQRDYQTARDIFNSRAQTSLSERWYHADAVYVVAVSGQEGFLTSLEKALLSPAFPLYLGRRSCPVTFDLVLGLREGDVETALRAEPWHAAAWYRKEQPTTVNLPIVRDARAGEEGERRRDHPVSFDPQHRRYEYRTVVFPPPVEISNDTSAGVDDPFLQAVMSL